MAFTRSASGYRILNLITKILFWGLILFSFLGAKQAQFAGKGMMLRVLTYPLAALAAPLFSRLKFKGAAYPHLAEVCILAPFIIDLAGNATGLYDSIIIFDDVAHFVNWAFLISGVGILLSYSHLGRLEIAALCIGLGATSDIVWELAEYAAMRYGASRLFLTYEDTVADLALSLGGSILAGLLSSTLFYGRENKTK